MKRIAWLNGSCVDPSTRFRSECGRWRIVQIGRRFKLIGPYGPIYSATVSLLGELDCKSVAESHDWTRAAQRRRRPKFRHRLSELR